mmetsp:Transcript_1477/g.2266  ORF Transcript_1477/g.2266 Transcript_1477/m.2266 type:complete len:390 (+) Transcript_1477:76-1245(+)|eukprot:CAMPEP_0196133456 /NCGR_PEP_ID=MMETSP0910-20130528/2673_1 /TAXON_ID=49265 /ORGANISM="Thalassiosira rotula, Strain GSO102" /LENGTH=389 /DNA_ID=CAMNT_0041393185 /DNA_START=63 /DNA_END=1232 /DNA_ORIENTATION=-
MKLFLSALTLMLAKADNTPDLCKDDIANLEVIAPSETVTDGHIIPNITVGGETYSGDFPHFVVNPGGKQEKIIVYIPGTTDRPSLSSCLIKSMSETLSFPVLALSYQYLSSGDKFRNGKCALLVAGEDRSEQINCLTQQHIDAIDGGDYGATNFKADGSAFWGEVLPENSLTRRLGDLLILLNERHPAEKWSNFLQDDMLTPAWEKIIFSGHSQGSGHVAYLAQTKSINGAVMISGPQDECIDCPEGTNFWIDDEYASSPDTPYTALAQGSEPLFSVMADNWMRMKIANPDINWKKGPQSTSFGLNTTKDDAIAAPLFTDVDYGDRSTCGGKLHCSVAIDDSVPYISTTKNDTFYLYEATVWPSILKAGSGKKTGKGKKEKQKKMRGGK